jgi:two-component system, chemotaxis family, protein-glutamate methylesterase/glutaminase
MPRGYDFRYGHRPLMPRHDIVVIGGSAGSLRPLTAIVERLPAGFDASVLVVIHTATAANGARPRILSRAGALRAAFGRDREPLLRGRIYVAPPDCHLIVADSAIRVVHGPRENGFRPAIDPLFRTAARQFGSRAIGVVLSGALSDGTYGLNLVKQHGGVAIVQHPDEADIDSMPRSAMAALDVDYVLPAAEIAATLTRLSDDRTAAAPLHQGQTMPRSDDLEPQLPTTNTHVSEMEDRFGAAASSLTCPDCGGALWEIHEGRALRYQCHVGHQYAPDSLDAKQRDAVDSALWSAVRVLEEHVELKTRMATRAAEKGLEAVSQGFAQGARDADVQAQRIRALLFAAETATKARAAAARRPSSIRRTASARKNGRKKSERLT